ncbi:hypothetical protein GGR53DRAFT_254031 [Hypoxylon sp. FL1150]|nr:hypothetical protein GGR53DRAFT_254031 [Hypoxylon sp. FL1150]
MAPTEKTEKVDKTAVFTDKETLVLALSWQCFKTMPDIDVDKLANLAGYANPRSVSNLLSVIKKKIATLSPNSGAAGGEGGPSTPTPKKPKATPRKRKPASDGGDDPTPTKRPRGRKAAALSKPTVDDGDDDSEADKKAAKKEEVVDDDFEV